MIIRQAVPDDAGSIETLLNELGYPPADEKFVASAILNYRQEGYRLLVGELGDEVVAFISLHWFDMFHSKAMMGRITAFCVSDHVRSSGIGGELLRAAEQLFSEKGCSKIEVTCNLKRSRTHEFYLKNGYSIDSKRFIKSMMNDQ